MYKNEEGTLEIPTLDQPFKAQHYNRPIQVFIRIRPMTSEERAEKDRKRRSYRIQGKILHVLSESNLWDMFNFNGIFGEHATFADVFEPVEKLIENALIGFKVTIFAFGQTGSCKTYTMSGGPDKKDGLIQQTFEFLRNKFK